MTKSTTRSTADGEFLSGLDVTGALTADTITKVSTGDLDLLPISTTITDTAVDVFVYDTSKDSDGGAWRKRTQATSWYNETLNTSTRGSRKDFPAVAVIVAESNKVTIYDGDDPAMPMWMVFETSGTAYRSKMLPRSVVLLKSSAMLNGMLVVGGNKGTSYHDALLEVSFLKDEAFSRGSGNTDQFTTGISGRNNTSVVSSTHARIVSATINDIAMTVLPNAPIDSATGLPIPTIAVATNGGVSVIKDDGSVVDITNGTTSLVAFVSFTDDDRILAGVDAGVGAKWIQIFDIPNGDVAYGFSAAPNNIYDSYEGSGINRLMLTPKSSVVNSLISGGGLAHAGATEGLGIGTLNPVEVGVQNDNMVTHITKDYNTGYMVGDIKLAALSDTDDTDVVGTELVTNGTFDTDASGWATNNGSSITWNGSGDQTATVTSNGVDAWNGATQVLTGLTIGKTYVATANIITSSNWGAFGFAAGANSGNRLGSYTAWNGGSSFPMAAQAQFVATATTLTLSIDSLNTVNATVTKIDNISVRLADTDRSVNANGLAVHGTITKSAVATGADLVAYSGFSASNYLEQPYNSDLDFGTGDFSVMGWVSTSSTSPQTLLHRGDGDDSSWGTSPILQIELSGVFKVGIYTGGFGSAVAVAEMSASELATGAMRHLVITQSGGYLKLYLDSVLKASASSVGTVTNTSASTRIGNRPYSTRPWLGSIANFRISATAPTAAQIKTIYEAEKVLFQENAQATLYGTSDAVTALAHDSDTDLLHVGTSSGRSVFQGLRRVDNTTTAVGAAISAANGLVVED